MNKYKHLISNTLVFGISTFGSKVLVFLLLPLYTRLLSPSEMGTAELITSTCNLILPVMYLSISESVIRFGMEKSCRKSDVFSVGIYTVLAGYLILWCFFPLIAKIGAIKGYTHLVYIYVLTSALRTMITQFVRASGFVKLFALDGMFTTAATVAFNLVFLLGFNMGITGYVLAVICADGLSALCLFFMLRLYRFLRVRGINKETWRDMLHYALPMIPSAVFWWVTNLSDRYFVTYLCGEHINGLYTIAYRIPTMITLVSAVFTQAWQLSAFSEYKSAEGERFYSTVFRSYYTFVFLAASGIILLIKPLMTILLDPGYFESWVYVPFLVLAVSFSCLVTFLGAVYNAAKKNVMVSVTTFLGAAVNIGLNALLIPVYGAQGAAVATFISFLLVFVIRAVDTRRYIRIKMQPWRILFSLVLLLGQAFFALNMPPLWVLWEALIFAALVVSNFGYIMLMLRRLPKLLPGRRRQS